MSDLISRQAAIDYFVTNVGFHDEDGYPIEDECELREIWTGYFDGIPPAESESDYGRWERHYSRPGVYADLYWHCSKCGYKTDYQYANVNYHYCPHCGRKMEREVSNE